MDHLRDLAGDGAVKAFDQVLVVRGVLVDSIQFVSGEGAVTIHYEVSRPANATLRLLGNGVDDVIDARLANPGSSRFDWDAQIDGAPVGMQVIGRHHADGLLLDVAGALEILDPWPLVAP